MVGVWYELVDERVYATRHSRQHNTQYTDAMTSTKCIEKRRLSISNMSAQAPFVFTGSLSHMGTHGYIAGLSLPIPVVPPTGVVGSVCVQGWSPEGLGRFVSFTTSRDMRAA
jgi:hypothetical protein